MTDSDRAAPARPQVEQGQSGSEGGDMALRLRGYRLATAEILYHMPDYPAFLQTFVWQQLDLAPKFPVLRDFLDFWEANIDGKLHSVRVASVGLISPAEFRYAGGEFRLH